MGEVVWREELVAVLDGPDAKDEIVNPVHSSEGARQLGYAAALVGGISVYSWALPAITSVVGEEWMTRGWCEIDFRAPVYPGEIVEIVLQRSQEERSKRSDRAVVAAAQSDHFILTIVKKKDKVVACVGKVGIGSPPSFGEIDRISTRMSPAAVQRCNNSMMRLDEKEGRPFPASGCEDYRRLIGRELPPYINILSSKVGTDAHNDLQEWYGSRIHPRHRQAFDRLQILHPMVLVAGRATPLLHQFFQYGLSIHTSTKIIHKKMCRFDEDGTITILVTGIIVDVFEKKGKDYVVVNVCVYQLVLQTWQEVARFQHTEILRVAPPQQQQSNL